MFHLITAFGENYFFCSYLERDFQDTVFSLRGQHHLFISLSKGKDKEVHKSQISRGMLVDHAESRAIPGRWKFHLPGLLL